MSSDELRRAFTVLTDEVKIMHDPYGRLMRRHRHRCRVRAASWTTGVAGALAALLLGPIGLQGQAAPDATPRPSASPVPPAEKPVRLTAWTKRLISGPTRGALADDKAFIDELTIRLMRLDLGAMRGHLVKVLFAEDVGDHRIVIAARYSETHQVGLYIAGHRGETPVELTEWSREVQASISRWINSFSDLTPYVAFGFGSDTSEGMTFTGVSLAPAGCELATARRSDQGEQQWQVASGEDYLVWPTNAVTDFDARVTCDGVTRFDGPLIDPNDLEVEGQLPDADKIARALENTRGTVPAEIAQQLIGPDIYATGPVRILYGGPVPGADATAYLAITPAGNGRWKIKLRIGKGGLSMITSTDVAASDAVFVVGGLADLPKSLVFAPSEAVMLTILDEAGAVVDEIGLIDGIGAMEEPKGSFRLEARNAAGQVVGTGQLPLRTTHSAYRMDPVIENWN